MIYKEFSLTTPASFCSSIRIKILSDNKVRLINHFLEPCNIYFLVNTRPKKTYFLIYSCTQYHTGIQRDRVLRKAPRF